MRWHTSVNTWEEKMKRKAVWISCILAALFCGRSANARVIMTVEQVGINVVATGGGTLDITGLNFSGGTGAACI
jgi:uncharacterized integral membrane protein